MVAQLKSPGIPAKLFDTVKVQVKDLVDVTKSRISPPVTALDDEQRAWLADIRRQGYVVVEGYWDRRRALDLRDKLLPFVEDAQSKELDCGAYVHCRANDKNYDSGVRRIHRVDRIFPELKEHRFNKRILDVAAAYCGIPFYSGALMFQHNIAGRGTRYFHVDTYRKEMKSFLYLDDVDENNGPFTFIPGSHKARLRRIRKQIIGNTDEVDTTFFDRDIGPMLKREKPLCAPAGSLIIADVRGLHRGMPQRDGTRSILVNYLVTKPHELELDR